MKIYIPTDISIPADKKELFILCRPFYCDGKWGNDAEIKSLWSIQHDDLHYTSSIEEANMMLLPYSINAYVNTGKLHMLKQYSDAALNYGVPGFAYIWGDYGIKLPEFPGFTYFRMGGFASQLSRQNQGFPVALSDHHNRIYGSEEILVREKSDYPVIGFCGNASFSILKRTKQSIKIILENVRRALQNPFRKDWEPLFPSVYLRARILRGLERTRNLRTNFIYREQYRAGVTTEKELMHTTLEYYDNIRASDYILCMRGGGNFSVRFYETLMMGRIPVFINTDCLLPFPDKINWRKHVVWVEWENRHQIEELVAQHYNSMNQAQFAEQQWMNRRLWKETLSVRGIFNLIQK